MNMNKTIPLLALLLPACFQGVPEERCDIDWPAGVTDACYVGWAAQQSADERAEELGCGPAPLLYVDVRIEESRAQVDGQWAVDEYSRLSSAKTCDELWAEPEMVRPTTTTIFYPEG